jgi:molybdate transport system permease protein
VFLVWPVLALGLSSSPSRWLSGLSHPSVLPALCLSAWTTFLSLVATVLLGTPLAWLLAHARNRAARVIEMLVLLPVVMPPAVAGLALLLAFGRRSLLARVLYPEGGTLAFTSYAVVLAQLFVAAPFFVQGAIAAFRRLDEKLLLTARSFGVSPWQVFWQVGVPMARAGLVSAAALSCARALGEFGATLMFAGNTIGVTQTLPLAIYGALESDLDAARSIALLQLTLALGLLLLVRYSDASADADARDREVLRA